MKTKGCNRSVIIPSPIAHTNITHEDDTGTFFSKNCNHKFPVYPFLAQQVVTKDPKQGKLSALTSLSMSFPRLHKAEAAQPSPGPRSTGMMGCRSTQPMGQIPPAASPGSKSAPQEGRQDMAFCPTYLNTNIQYLIFTKILAL